MQQMLQGGQLALQPALQEMQRLQLPPLASPNPVTQPMQPQGQTQAQAQKK